MHERWKKSEDSFHCWAVFIISQCKIVIAWFLLWEIPCEYTRYLVFIQLKRSECFQKDGLVIQKCPMTYNRGSPRLYDCLTRIPFWKLLFFMFHLFIFFSKTFQLQHIEQNIGANWQRLTQCLEDNVRWIPSLFIFQGIETSIT